MSSINDQHDGQTWFEARIDSPRLSRTFATRGSHWVGGRLDVAAAKPSPPSFTPAAKHIIDVFVENDSSEKLTGMAPANPGYHWLTWQQNGFSSARYPDVAPADLAN